MIFTLKLGFFVSNLLPIGLFIVQLILINISAEYPYISNVLFFYLLTGLGCMAVRLPGKVYAAYHIVVNLSIKIGLF